MALVTVGELAALLAAGGEEAPSLLDVRWRLAGASGAPGIEGYLAGHIPGAVFVDLDRDLAGPPGAGGRHPLPAAGSFQAAMRRAGVSDGRMVVVYDDGDSTAAARAWWLLRYFGHSRVRVLDGGYRAWTRAGQPSAISLQPSEPGAPGAPPQAVPAGDFTASPGHLPLLDAAGAANLARARPGAVPPVENPDPRVAEVPQQPPRA
ncbi:rhodanese-like domain-containing protein, partial [Trebonia sp.]|uniref:sulfurtransferase n=1 Tax=Trebonia sp. TaxID=2767075 RepID=UPI002608F937